LYSMPEPIAEGRTLKSFTLLPPGFMSGSVFSKEDPYRDLSAAIRFGQDDKGEGGASWQE
jgi:hypothetical protein